MHIPGHALFGPSLIPPASDVPAFIPQGVNLQYLKPWTDEQLAGFCPSIAQSPIEAPSLGPNEKLCEQVELDSLDGLDDLQSFATLDSSFNMDDNAMTPSSPENPQKLFTVREVADSLRMSCAAVYRLTSGGSLACLRIGGPRGAIRITQADLDDFLARSRATKHPMPHRAPTTVRLRHLRL